MAKGYYISGTDTGVGKTHVSVALLRQLNAGGIRAIGMKPVASGCDQIDGAWQNDDALSLQAASVPQPTYALVNPFALPAATAPQIAARAAGVAVELGAIVAAHAQLALLADTVIVEGVGGWLAPLAENLEQAYLARALGLPVILVVAVRLGCINHARLTERAIRADGLELAGWIANLADAQPPQFLAEYEAELARLIDAPRLGRCAHGAARFDHDLRLSIG